MPNPNIDQLLDELYVIDPSLRGHESQVRAALVRLMRQSPSFTLSPTTIQTIQTSMMEQQPVEKRKLAWPALIGIPSIAAAVVAGFLLYPKSPTPNSSGSSKGVTITAKGSSAFGAFVDGTRVNANRNALATSESDVATPTKDSGAGMILPSGASASFVYADQITIPQLPVLQRTKGFSSNASLSAGGLLNLGTIDGLRVDTLSASQQTADGYYVSIDYRDGNVSMYKNSGLFKSMAEPAVLGTREGVSSVAPDVSTMSKTSAVSAAKTFAQTHGISTAGYADPFVQVWSGQTVSDEKVPAPAVVVFPLVLNGQPVYDESGNRYGLQMTVDQNGDVLSVYNLTTLQFTSSTYAVTTDTKAISDYLARGGWMWSGISSGAKKYSVDAPTSGYVISRYSVDQTTNEYYVPALIFPVKAADQLSTGRTSIVVPVLDSLLKQQVNVMPVIDLPASTGSGSAAGSTEPTSLPE